MNHGTTKKGDESNYTSVMLIVLAFCGVVYTIIERLLSC
jgi:hypothetical protein